MEGSDRPRFARAAGQGLGALTHQAPGMADEAVPLEGRAGVHLVGLDVEMAEDALVVLEVGFRQFAADELSGSVPGVIAFDPGQDFAQCGGKPDQGLVLLGREIVLEEVAALDDALHGPRPGRAADERHGSEPSIAIDLRDRNACRAAGLSGVPFAEWILFATGVGADVGEFDAHRTAVRAGGVPGALLHVQGLVNRPVQVEQEMDAQIA